MKLVKNGDLTNNWFNKWFDELSKLNNVRILKNRRIKELIESYNLESK